MTSKTFWGCVLISLFLIMGRVGPARAQVHLGPGVTVFSQTWTPTYMYPYGYYGYPAGPWFVFPVPGPYASRYLPSYSYTPNPYAQVPGAAAYGAPPYTYFPNAYTYDLYPQSHVYPWGIYYAPGSYPYVYYFGPRYARLPYRAMTMREYLARQRQGPTRVRDIVPGEPGLRR